MSAIPVKQFVEEMVRDINQVLQDLPDDKAREVFLNGLSESYFNMPYQTEENKDE